MTFKKLAAALLFAACSLPGLIPAIAMLLTQQVKADPNSASSKQILSIFDTGNCTDQDGKVAKAPIRLGERDARSGDFVLMQGLVQGDQVIRYPTAMLRDNQPIQAAQLSQSAPKAAMAVPTSSAAATN